MAVEAGELLGLHARAERVLVEAMARVRGGVVGRGGVSSCSCSLLPLVLVDERPLILLRLERPFLALGRVELLLPCIICVEARAILQRAKAACVQMMR